MSSGFLLAKYLLQVALMKEKEKDQCWKADTLKNKILKNINIICWLNWTSTFLFAKM